MCSWKRAICVPGKVQNVFLEKGNMCSWNRAICVPGIGQYALHTRRIKTEEMAKCTDEISILRCV